MTFKNDYVKVIQINAQDLTHKKVIIFFLLICQIFFYFYWFVSLIKTLFFFSID